MIIDIRYILLIILLLFFMNRSSQSTVIKTKLVTSPKDIKTGKDLSTKIKRYDSMATLKGVAIKNYENK